ncbi:MAG: hypothetical protein PHS57_08825 [Alphaproteobacteria bacterium]|nr:hypothetical protein [Alphaproteobacteria bacterium]
MSNVNPILSDLFFNHDHGIQIEKIPSKVLYDQVILDSARDFVKCYAPILRCHVPTAEELADDFHARV